MNQPVLSVKNLTKAYRSGDQTLVALRDVTFALFEGDTCAIVGPSGSGKTTLLALCAGLDRQTSGSVTLCGAKIDELSEDERAKIRNRFVGFVFQNFQLIPTLTALENVLAPLELRGGAVNEKDAVELLARVGLEHRLHHYPAQLSGGEQQRVAIARAFINRPKILFADEPTGNLDGETSQKVERLLFELNREAKTTLALVTHNLDLARKTERIIRLKNGVVVSDERNEPIVADAPEK
ncbi:MAG: ABC transporter ATP-binding protein [Chloroherpetonaceae bacterium]|nr:ABC transporter ATP-binding protein [Chloroherpetonaceae bacterium]MDW8437587.1 ABC transporter ATP-binding protein [Chloroherpetonaceae bacterium]